MTVAVLPAILFMTPVYWVYGLVTKKEIVNE